jgi:hypothetical protein
MILVEVPSCIVIKETISFYILPIKVGPFYGLSIVTKISCGFSSN